MPCLTRLPVENRQRGRNELVVGSFTSNLLQLAIVAGSLTV